MRSAAALVICCLVGLPCAGGEGPRLGVEPPDVDFGRLRPGVVVTRVLMLRNFGDQPLVIERIATDCGCTVVKGWKERLAPGESTELNVSLRVGTEKGPFVRSVIVKSNDAERPLVGVKLRAEIGGGRLPRARPEV